MDIHKESKNKYLPSRTSILLLFVLLGFTAFLISCGSETEKSDEEEVTAEAAHPGEKVYKKYCITCHGTDGSMGSNGAFNLRETKLSVEEKIAVITKGRNTMTAFEKVLKPEEISAVAEFTEKFRQ
jgi:mono/diheme cytochrome c family protein